MVKVDEAWKLHLPTSATEISMAVQILYSIQLIEGLLINK